jgi:drug/metabolite transporter (DMT)-like permease
MRKNSSVTASFYSIMFMAIFAIAFCSPWEIPSIVAKDPAVTLPLIIALGVVTHVIPYLLYSNAMSFLPAGTTTAMGIVEPMSATLFSIVLLGEVPTVWSIIGIALILLAVFLLSRTENETEKRKE